MPMATDVPTSEELVRRASELVPLLQKHAPWGEEHRRLHDEVVEALADAGMFKLRRPKRYGGYENDTRTLVVIAVRVPSEGEPYPIMALVPMSDLLIVDDWHTFGLKGTGSVSTVAKDVL